MMLALDKKRDISIMASMGADSSLLKKVFITEGLLIAAIGTVLGLVLGAGIVLLQQNFSLDFDGNEFVRGGWLSCEIGAHGLRLRVLSR